MQYFSLYSGNSMYNIITVYLVEEIEASLILLDKIKILVSFMIQFYNFPFFPFSSFLQKYSFFFVDFMVITCDIERRCQSSANHRWTII